MPAWLPTDGMFTGIKLTAMNNHSTYYETKLMSGSKFQDFIAVEFAKIGIPITNFSSKLYQIKKGENLQGFEIKNDEMFRKTGNIWIECSERFKPENEYVESGIFRSDNTRFYVIGDYQGVFLMQKKILKLLSKKYEERENTRKTSKGFLLPVLKAEEYFDYIEFQANSDHPD